MALGTFSRWVVGSSEAARARRAPRTSGARCRCARSTRDLLPRPRWLPGPGACTRNCRCPIRSNPAMVCLRRRGRAGVRRNRDGRSRLSSDQHRDTAPRPLRRRSRRTPPLAKLLRGCRHGSCVPPPWLSRSRSVQERDRGTAAVAVTGSTWGYFTSTRKPRVMVWISLQSCWEFLIGVPSLGRLPQCGEPVFLVGCHNKPAARHGRSLWCRRTVLPAGWHARYRTAHRAQPPTSLAPGRHRLSHWQGRYER